MQKTLNDTQANFFSQVAVAAFTNPFSKDAKQKETALLPNSTVQTSEQKHLESLLGTLKHYFQQVSIHNVLAFKEYPEQQQEVLQISWLFYQYRKHQFLFDQFIKQQKQAGDNLLTLPFAQSLLKELGKAGFSSTHCEKFLALFFQLRRGFYFISRTLAGTSPCMTQLRNQLWQNLFTFQPQWYLHYLCEQMEDFSTLLLGETGTGKSTVASAIGCSGFIPFDPQRNQFKTSFTDAFQAINLSQYPAGLLESELFGHKKGAFTGAIDNHQGIFARCSEYGSVFIDEIGEIDIPTQVKLLTVIQDRVFTPVGDHRKQRFEGRVIAATNQNIEQLRSRGLFRNDLYYRLCSDVISVPTLRQRLLENPEELRILTATIVAKILPDAPPDLYLQIEQRIRQCVPQEYHWPGNVRELEQCIRRICLTGTYAIEQNFEYSEPSLAINGEPTVQQMVTHYCIRLYEKHGSYEAVARITGLDRRTVKKYIDTK